MFQQIRKGFLSSWLLPVTLLAIGFGLLAVVYQSSVSSGATHEEASSYTMVLFVVLLAVLGIPALILFYRQISLKWPKPKHSSKIREKVRSANAWQYVVNGLFFGWMLILFFSSFILDTDSEQPMISFEIALICALLSYNFLIFGHAFLVRWGWAIKIGPWRRFLRAKRRFGSLWQSKK